MGSYLAGGSLVGGGFFSGGVFSGWGGFFSGGFFVGESFFIVFFLVGALHGQACFMAQKKFAACKNDARFWNQYIN